MKKKTKFLKTIPAGLCIGETLRTFKSVLKNTIKKVEKNL